MPGSQGSAGIQKAAAFVTITESRLKRRREGFKPQVPKLKRNVRFKVKDVLP